MFITCVVLRRLTDEVGFFREESTFMPCCASALVIKKRISQKQRRHKTVTGCETRVLKKNICYIEIHLNNQIIINLRPFHIYLIFH